MRLLETVAADGVLVEALLTAKSETPIGIICMYSAQKARLEEVFSRRPWDVRFLGTVRIDTVDSYQGKENMIVIVSLVRSNKRGDQGHVRMPNRCNVALSRAKERLFIVGARSMWGSVHKRWPMNKGARRDRCRPRRSRGFEGGRYSMTDSISGPTRVRSFGFNIRCRRFLLRANVRRDRRLPVVDEFVLRALKMCEDVPARRLATYFGFTPTETGTVMADLKGAGLITLEGDTARLHLSARRAWRATCRHRMRERHLRIHVDTEARHRPRKKLG